MVSRKTFVALLASLALVGVGASAQAEGAGRTDVARYEFGAGIHHEQSSAIWTLAVPTWATFETQPGERRVRIVVDDVIGTASLIHVHVDRDNDHELDVDRTFCSSKVNLKVNGDTTITVFPMTGTCDDGTMSVATQGEITATFSR